MVLCSCVGICWWFQNVCWECWHSSKLKFSVFPSRVGICSFHYCTLGHGKNFQAKLTDRDKLITNRRFHYSDFAANFVAVISSQSEGLGKMALMIVKIYLGSPFLANQRCLWSVCLRSVVVDPTISHLTVRFNPASLHLQICFDNLVSLALCRCLNDCGWL